MATRQVRISDEVYELLEEMSVTSKPLVTLKAMLEWCILEKYPLITGHLPHPADAEPVAYGYGRLASHPLPAVAEEPK